MCVPFSLHVSCYCKNLCDRGASGFGLEGVYNLMGVLSMVFFFFFTAVHIVPQLLFVTTAIIIFQLTYPLENVICKYVSK